MPVLRSAKSKRLLPPLPNSSRPRSMHCLGMRKNFSKATVKIEPVSSVSNTEIVSIRKCLQSSPSEARFYSDICEEELKKLVKERDTLNKNIQDQLEYNRRKDCEAARIVKKLWEEANKRVGSLKQSRMRGKGALKKLTPSDVKKVFEEAKKMSNHLKLKRKLLVSKKQRLDSKIHLAIETIKFCRRFGNIRR